MKKIVYIFLMPVFFSCSWMGLGEEDPYAGMTSEEEFQARNEKTLSQQANVHRSQYMKNMQTSQEVSANASKAKPRDFAKVRQKMSHAEYKRIQAQAELGDEDACYQMGVIHKYGFYTGKPNLAAALRWFENAAALGSIKARHQLKYMSRRGRPEYQR